MQISQFSINTNIVKKVREMDAFSVPIEITTDRKRKFGTLFGTVATVCMFGFI